MGEERNEEWQISAGEGEKRGKGWSERLEKVGAVREREIKEDERKIGKGETLTAEEQLAIKKRRGKREVGGKGRQSELREKGVKKGNGERKKRGSAKKETVRNDGGREEKGKER